MKFLSCGDEHTIKRLSLELLHRPRAFLLMSEFLDHQEVQNSQRNNRKGERDDKNAAYRSALDDATGPRFARGQLGASFRIIGHSSLP